MKKNYRKPTIESVKLKNEKLLTANSPCNQDQVGICTSKEACDSDIY